VGKTPLDRARGEMLLDAFQDIVRPFFPKFFPEKDEAKKVLPNLIDSAYHNTTQLN
jgi:hypothetical protein